MRGLGGTVAALALLAGSQAAVADTADQTLLKASVAIWAPIATADGVVAACDRIDPAGAEERGAALSAWRAAEPVAAFEAAFARAAAASPALASAPQAIRKAVDAKVDELARKQPALCRDPKGFFGAASMRLGDRVAAFETLAAAPRGAAPAPSAAAAAPPVTLRSLARLSVILDEAMDAAGAKPTGRDRERTKARAEAAEAALKTIGIVAIRGRAVDTDEIREWRGERESRFSVRCRSFVDDAAKAAFRAQAGKDVAVAGLVRLVSEGSGEAGGRVTLNRCALLSADSQGVKVDSGPDEAGLMARPMEREEAFLGAGKGIDPSDVEAVIYDAAFSNRMDGFGNGYVDRREDIYVLLDDNTAYRHEWPFPFTDLDVEQSKRREPKRWFSWKTGWFSSALTLTPNDGGEPVVIEKPSRLKPLAAGARLDHRYYYLTVAMGGSRRDCGFAFRADGTVTATRSSFLAANTGYGGGDVSVAGPGFAYSGGGAGQGHVAAAGPKSEIVARYEISDWALTLTTPDGAIERRFFARPETDDGDPPDSVVIDGEIHWTRRK